MSKKKGFVLYFDACPAVMLLPPEQRGWLVSAVFSYAIQVAEDPDTSMERVLSDFPALSDPARMACQFICAAVKRDTERWNRRCAANQRQRKQAAPAGDTGWMKQYMPRREDTP